MSVFENRFKNVFLVLISLFILLFINNLSVSNSEVRIKDIARILEVRSNQIMGYGLVVGLQNTGDSTGFKVSNIALNNLLNRQGFPKEIDNKSRNIASVLVSAELPPFSASGSKIDVVVSSLGDATSLKGGTLLQTPLSGADGNVYAVAQGSLLIADKAYHPGIVRRQVRTSGQIPRGAIVEREVPIALVNTSNILTIVLNNPDFTMASRVSKVLNENGIFGSYAINASNIEVPLVGDDYKKIVKLIARIENLKVEPVSFAKVVVNQKTGAIVIGQHVKLSPAIVSFGNIHVTIGEYESDISIREEKAKILKLQPDPTLSSLAAALNSIGATTSDLISILQILSKSGALTAEIEVI